MPKLERLPKTTVFEAVVGRLRDLVESGEVRPGERLPSERELALSLGVNRSSVREALRVLSAAGLLDVRHGSGVFVREAAEGLDLFLLPLVGGEAPAEILPDLLEARSVLESALARLAAGRVKTEDLAVLDAAFAVLEDAVSRGEAPLEADRAFHLEVARLSGNRVLHALVRTTYSLTEGRFDAFFATGNRARRTLAQHGVILERIRAGDPRGAEEAMAAHMRDTASAWLRHEARR